MLTGDKFILEATQLRKRLREDVFSSTLSTEELQAVDLKANAHLFPELVNRDADLRQRRMKEYEREQNSGRFAKRQKLDDGRSGYTPLASVLNPDAPSPKEVVDALRAEAKWFQDFYDAAKK